ncbi:hypothetical protein L486_06633 [Kwoniella mangroviensis CBS 10435]|uniref:BZIP domain-containing protein n=1 Tax=Kwoniella mangroviensis CBS 10435 TaxID=1331196 RepID=A0A1B9IK57_9TREE|nr:hypothetical protein L486_06633 [Kwoniella mangroviensis CBS 10435]
MGKNTDPTMGGLDALVAAASSVAGQGKKRAGNRNVSMDMIDPALQNETATDVADAMSVFLSNPAVVQLIAEYNAKKQHRQVSLYAQLLSGSNIPDTPAQQTRSGRISRPPQQQPSSSSSTTIQNDQQNQLQAIKDALENVSSINDPNQSASTITDSANYDALFQAVNNNNTNDSSSNSSRFWRNDGLLSGLPNWTGLEANTLAQAVASTDPSSSSSASVLEGNGTGDDSFESVGAGSGKRYKGDDLSKLDGENGEHLPEWPLPPTGKGGRKNMPREELLARRRARNRVAAQESRKKKKEFFGNITDKLKDRDQAFENLQAHCRRLEQEVEALKKVILGAGLELPNDIPTPIDMPNTSFPITEDTPMTINSVSPGEEIGVDLPFHDLFTIDDNDNDADDLDFIPPSSPRKDGDDGSDSEGEFSDEDDDVNPPFANTGTKTKSNNKKGKRKSSKDQSAETPISTIAEDVEEDLFLPIEDVPIPPRDEEDQEKVMKQAMNELHVDTPQQLMGVIKKMVETAGYGGVTEEQVAMLSKLLALGQAQGMSIW